MNLNSNSIGKESRKSPRRRAFPFVQKLEHFKVDLDRIREEFNLISADHDWNDMNHGSELVEKLIKGRDRLTKAFQDEDGGYSKYHQILLTEFDKNKADGRMSEGSSGYKSEVFKEDPYLNEANYNAYRDFMDRAPYLKGVLGQFRDPVMRARFARVAAGFSIGSHIDYDIPYGTRFHLAIQSNEKCRIGFRKTPKEEFSVFEIPCDGHFYFVNVGFEHYAENLGQTPRTHLVVSVDGYGDIDEYRLPQ